MKFLSACVLFVTMGSSYGASYYGYHGPPAPIGHDGSVVYTPEVAHARAAHFAAFADAASKASYSAPTYTENRHNAVLNGYSRPAAYSAEMSHHEQGYHGPLAPLDHEGRVVDTPEVAEAKAAHFAAYNHAATHTYSTPYSHGYHGASAPLSHDGRVLDTPEVAHAKAAHRIAYENAKHASSFNHYRNY